MLHRPKVCWRVDQAGGNPDRHPLIAEVSFGLLPGREKIRRLHVRSCRGLLRCCVHDNEFLIFQYGNAGQAINALAGLRRQDMVDAALAEGSYAGLEPNILAQTAIQSYAVIARCDGSTGA